MSHAISQHDATPALPRGASLAAWYALFVLSLAVLYAVIDRQVLMLLAQPLKTDLDLSDTQIGSLQGLGAVLFSSIAVVPLGWLADRMDRRMLLALCILVWSIAVAACGLATNYWTLLACVALLGAGEAGLSPIVFALIPDLFPERLRMTANFIFYSAVVLGAGAGIAVAGAVVQNIGVVSEMIPSGRYSSETWRLVFFIVAVPGPFLALAIGLIRLQRRAAPKRSVAAIKLSTESSKLSDHLASNWKAICAVFVPYGLASLGASAIFTWMPVILMRESGLSAGEVGAGLGGAMTMGGVAGLALAGATSRFLRPRWGALTPVRLSAMGYLVYALLTPLHLLARTPNDTLLIATVQMAMVIGGNSLMPTLMQDLGPRYLLGRIFAISTVIATLFQVASPIAVGLLSDHLFMQAGGLLRASIFVAFPSILAAAFILRLAEGNILTTVDRVRAQGGVA